MPNCLGLYIEDNLIKYAKVSKEHDTLKVEAFGIKFYDKIGDAINQVIEETYSQKTPISINLSEEIYNYFEMFAKMNKADLQKAIQTEFESYCADNGYSSNTFETRYAVSEMLSNNERLKIIHVSDNKIELNKRIQLFSAYKLSNISPLPMSIPNLMKLNKNENCVIVNMENKTTITTLFNDGVYDVVTLDEGSEQILSTINLKENSYSKAYEICKNTTIYTSEGKELQEDEINYLEDIMPTLYTIVGQVKKIVNSNEEKIGKVYITGTMALINNVDLYFQEYLPEVNCEILRPHFINTTKDISIKDYVEVNSAISMALMGLDEGMAGMNFKKQGLANKLPSWLTVEVNTSKSSNEPSKIKEWFKWDFSETLDRTEKSLIRTAAYLIVLVIIYSGFSILLNKTMTQKQQDAEKSIASTQEQISMANSDSSTLNTRTNQYTNMIRNLQDANDRLTDITKTRNAIPNLLNQIMSVIPENVQLTSIENTTQTQIAIEAQSNKYEQLGFFIARLKTEVILTNVISTAGEKDNGVIKVRIEGDLP